MDVVCTWGRNNGLFWMECTRHENHHHLPHSSFRCSGLCNSCLHATPHPLRRNIISQLHTTRRLPACIQRINPPINTLHTALPPFTHSALPHPHKHRTHSSQDQSRGRARPGSPCPAVRNITLTVCETCYAVASSESGACCQHSHSALGHCAHDDGVFCVRAAFSRSLWW
jgi:hypothetical protein